MRAKRNFYRIWPMVENCFEMASVLWYKVLYRLITSMGLFYKQRLIKAMAWISNYIYRFIYDIITHPCLFLNCRRGLRINWLKNKLLHPAVLHGCFQGATDTYTYKPWWRHQMETFSELLAICAGNSPVTGEFTAQRPMTRSFDVFFHLCLE